MGEGEVGIAPPILYVGTRWEFSASRSGRSIYAERDHGTHRIGGSAGMDGEKSLPGMEN